MAATDFLDQTLVEMVADAHALSSSYFFFAAVVAMMVDSSAVTDVATTMVAAVSG